MDATTAARLERRHRAAAILIAFLAHVAALPWLVSQFEGLGESAPAKASPVKVMTALSPKVKAELKKQREELNRLRQQRQAEKKKEEEKKKEQAAGPTVDVPPMASNEAPDNARYSSEHNTRVDRETKSRYQSQRYQNAMNEPTVTQKNPLSAPSTPSDAKALEIGPKKPAQEKQNKGDGQDLVFELPKLKARDRLALKLDPKLGNVRNHSQTEGIEGNGDRLRLSLGEASEQPEVKGSAPAQGAPAIELIPQVGVLARLPGAPANDYLEDVEEGDGTFLNTREFKYASFFNRMKRGVSQHWRAVEEYRRRDPSGNIYGFRSRITVLSVTLNPDGSLKNVAVQRSSGVDFLDSAAMSAFQRAEPFPNPPKGLVGPAGEISFPFGFYIDFSPGVRMPF